MAFSEQAVLDVLGMRPGVPYCVDCLAKAAGLTSLDDRRSIRKWAAGVAVTSEPTSHEGYCEVCHSKTLTRVVRSLRPRQ
jgi:hypothetical protein